MRKNGSQQRVKHPTTIAKVLAAFCSLLNLANLLARTPVEPDKLFTLVEQYLHNSALFVLLFRLLPVLGPVPLPPEPLFPTVFAIFTLLTELLAEKMPDFGPPFE